MLKIHGMPLKESQPTSHVQQQHQHILESMELLLFPVSQGVSFESVQMQRDQGSEQV